MAHAVVDLPAAELRDVRTFFLRELGAFTPADAGFAPAAGMRTVVQQVAHVAQTMDWFRTGAFTGHGFDMDFAAHERAISAVGSLAEATAWFERAHAALAAAVLAVGAAGLTTPLDGPIMPGQPRARIIGAVVDHTAHHRGSLAVYCRLLGRTPPMPYA